MNLSAQDEKKTYSFGVQEVRELQEAIRYAIEEIYTYLDFFKTKCIL